MKALLQVQQLSKRFGGLPVSQDISFSVNEGTCFGIIGPNGAGKTTLFNQIAGVYKPDSGSILFDGHQIAGKSPNVICKLGIARTFQIATGSPGLTVLESVTAGALNRYGAINEAQKRAEAVLSRLDLMHVRDSLVEELTVQYKKKVGVAVALATEPRLLLLDEVMAGLNPTEVAEFISLLKEINEHGITLVVIEHNMHSIRQLCSETIVLSFGQVLARGTPNEVLNDPDVIAAYLGRKGDPNAGRQ